MARLGLGPRWQCTFANDICEKKAAAYCANFPPAKELFVKNISDVRSSDLPGRADLAWASFPCQDLSLAGAGAGLAGHRSGTFWPFCNLIRTLRDENRAPWLIVLENVPGAVTSHGGKNFREIFRALVQAGYRVGPMVIDAVYFLPQSRPRLFVVAVDGDLEVPAALVDSCASKPWHPRSIRESYVRLPPSLRDRWVWWRLAPPPTTSTSVADLIEEEPAGVDWHSSEATARLLSHMSSLNLAKVEQARKRKRKEVGFVYRRTRPQPDGHKRQRAEVRFDGLSGCLRTPVGGSSRQIVLIVEGGRIRSRLLSPREAVRLMGLPDNYLLPGNYNEAYHVAGDGVAVPAVRHMAVHLLEPILSQQTSLDRAASRGTASLIRQGNPVRDPRVTPEASRVSG